MDVDGDGDFDFVISGDPEIEVPVQWLENRDGTFNAHCLWITGRTVRFQPIPQLKKEGRRTITMAADFNNDGMTDIYTSGCSNQFGDDHPLNCSTAILYENMGRGEFLAHEDNGIEPIVSSLTASAADVNGDGLLDIFVGESLPLVANNTGMSDTFRSKLYINMGNFKFKDSGLDVDNPGVCASSFVDINYDGHQDLITGACNALGPDSTPVQGELRVLKNTYDPDAGLGFEDATEEIFGTVHRGLWYSIAMVDLNNDGRIDVFAGNQGSKDAGGSHLLLISRSDGTYEDEAEDRGLAFEELTLGVDFVDFDNDGDADLVTSGASFTTPGLLSNVNPGRTFVNDGDGFFTAAGDLGLSKQFTTGLSTADFDDDGSMDVLVVSSKPNDDDAAAQVLTGEARLFLFKGTAPPARHVDVSLLGVESPRQGIGSFVNLCGRLGDKERFCQQRVVVAGTSFASTHAPVAHFGVPEGLEGATVEVVWPRGSLNNFTNVTLGRVNTFEESL